MKRYRIYSHTHKSWHKAKTRRIEMTESEIWLFYANNIITIYFRVRSLCSMVMYQFTKHVIKDTFSYEVASRRRTEGERGVNLCVCVKNWVISHFFSYIFTFRLVLLTPKLRTWTYNAKYICMNRKTTQCYNNFDVVGKRWLKLSRTSLSMELLCCLSCFFV